MFGLTRKLFAPKPGPIGVDFGSGTLRMAQCLRDGTGLRLIAAASRAVPTSFPSASARFDWFAATVRELLAGGRFVGRTAVLAVPSIDTHVCHVRTAVMEPVDLAKALPWELKGKLPIDPARAVLRHVVAGRVGDGNPQQDVIVMAASRGTIETLLRAAASVRLDVVGLNVDGRATVDCFGHVYRRRSDAEMTNCFVDLGNRGTRVTIARAGQIFFSRTIPIGGEDFTRAVAAALRITPDAAQTLLHQLAAEEESRVTAAVEKAAAERDAQTQATTRREASFATDRSEDAFFLPAAARAERRADDPIDPPEKRYDIPWNVVTSPQAVPGSCPDVSVPARPVEIALVPLISRLSEELNLCRRYVETTFAGATIDRLIFTGGQARQRGVCRQIASAVGLAAQIGDPLVRMAKTTTVGPESGMDLREPQPAWAVAVGLSLGPTAVSLDKSKTA